MDDGCDTPHRKALNSALRILARRDHSLAELVQKLTCRGYGKMLFKGWSPSVSGLTIWMTARAARQIIDRMKCKGMGHARIRGELQRRGMEGELAEALLRECVPAVEEQAMAGGCPSRNGKRSQRKRIHRKKKAPAAAIPSLPRLSDSVIFEVLKELRS